MTLRSPHEIHEADVHAIQELIAGCGSDDRAERERLLWQLVGIHAGSLTPVSENEKRGVERVLAILERKLAEGGGSTDLCKPGGHSNSKFRTAQIQSSRNSLFLERNLRTKVSCFKALNRDAGKVG